MASLANAFGALNAIGSGQAPGGAGKKKKSKAKKQGGQADAAEGPVPAPVAAGGAAQVVEVGEAVPVLDNAARTFKAGSDRLKLWKDWIKQAGDRSSRAITYVDTDSSALDFKQVMLRSRALEITIEGCLSSPPPPDHVPELQRLLATFLPRAGPAPALAAAVSRLSQLLSDDLQSYDTLGAAQRAAATLVASLKAEKPQAGPGAADPLARLNKLESEMAKEQGFLSKVSQGGVTKEHLSSAAKLVQLQSQKLDLLQGGGDGDDVSGARRAAVESLEELRSAISNHLRVARAQETGGSSAESARTTALASLQREEAKLADQAGKLHTEIRSLEAQLTALRAQVAEVEAQRARLRQRQSAAREALSSQQPGSKAPVGPGSKHYLEELAAADALVAIADPSAAAAASPELAEARAANADAASHYLGLVRQLLGLGLGALQEAPQKITLARTRLTQADKLSLLASTSKDAAAKADKQREEGEKQLAEAMRSAEAVVSQCAAALDGARRRAAALARGSAEQAAALGPHMRELEELMSHARAQLDAASMAASGAAPPAAAAPAVAPAVAAPFALAPGQGRPQAAAPGPIAPPAAAANGGPKETPAAAPAPARPRPATAAEALAALPPDGFQQVGGKKGRRQRA